MTVQRVFISYEHESGLGIAEKIAAYLEERGRECWYWERDNTAGAHTWDEIAEALVASDYVVFVVSEGSKASTGQKTEISIAINVGRRRLVAAVDLDMRPASLLGVNATTLTDGVEKACDRWLKQWERPAPRWTIKKESDPVE